MKIDWIYRKDEGGMVTFYDTNITLNKVASTYFVDAYAVLVGLDAEPGSMPSGRIVGSGEGKGTKKTGLGHLKVLLIEED